MSSKLSTPELLTADPESVDLDPQRLAHLGRMFEDEVARGRLPGAVALVARRGRVAWFKSIGRLGPEPSRPMPKDAIFRIYSMTKPVTSVAAMMLVEDGRLFLGDSVAKHLPELAGLKVGVERESVSRDATIQDLLRHTAGLTYEFVGDHAVQRLYLEADIGSRERSSEEFLRVMAELPLKHVPGMAWDYSRATDVLGLVIERLSGKALGEFFQERIFGPLRMADTAFHVPQDQHHRIAEPFPRDPDSGIEVNLFDPRTPAPLQSGGGGLMSTAADYARFLQMMLAGGKLDGARLLGRKTVELMTTDHLGAIPIEGDLLAAGHGFGLGFSVRTAQGVAPMPGSLGSYAWSGIGGTSFFVDPQEELFAMLLAQAPAQREHHRLLFRNLVYAAVD